MIKVNVEVSSKFWKKKIKNPIKYFNKKLKKISKIVKFFKGKDITFTILLTNSLYMKKLNKKFRNKNKSTDVLSFPFYEKKILFKLLKKKNIEIYLGDIVVNLKKIPFKNNIKDFQKKFDELWIHGLVHLLGGRHKTNKDFNSMSRIEKKFLNIIN